MEPSKLENPGAVSAWLRCTCSTSCALNETHQLTPSVHCPAFRNVCTAPPLDDYPKRKEGFLTVPAVFKKRSFVFVCCKGDFSFHVFFSFPFQRRGMPGASTVCATQRTVRRRPVSPPPPSRVPTTPAHFSLRPFGRPLTRGLLGN